MKKILIITFLILAISRTKGNAQTTGVSDTLAYLQTIVANKAQYIGRPFSELQSNLQIEIKFFSPFSAKRHRMNKETSTSFAFYFPLNAEQIYLTYPCLEIVWQTYLDANQSRQLYTQFNGGGWNPTMSSFYSSGIIADIRLLNP
jgi:hypothetical protein